MKNTNEKKSDTLQKFMEQFRIAAEKIIESLQYFVDAGEKPQWTEGWKTAFQRPFCPLTEHYYTGGNALMLELINAVKEYNDNRWLTFSQLNEFRKKYNDIQIYVRKGEKGVTLVRPEFLHFIKEETETEKTSWKLLSSKELKILEEKKKNGEDIPQIFRKIQFKPFVVFNAKQIEGFPEKENIENKNIDRPNMIECFIACSGVPLLYSKNNVPLYKIKEDIILMPSPECFINNQELTATLLHEFFHATGHENREKRFEPERMIKDKSIYALEEMKAESFALLAGIMLDVPFTRENSLAYLATWRQMLMENDNKNLYAIFTQSANMLETLQGFLQGQSNAPRPKWFPEKEFWEELCHKQDQQNEERGINDINLHDTLMETFPELNKNLQSKMSM